ncbi:putative tubulin polymerization-promoting protein [Sesbania bispinosa]|nr:putative tubulin polymerization-promoting protein [Sesbania bispinosa]
MNQRVPNEHVTCKTELNHVGMNLNPWGQVQSAFGARVKQEGEGVLVGLQETTSHGGVKGEGLGRRRVTFGVATNDGVEGEDGRERD